MTKKKHEGVERIKTASIVLLFASAMLLSAYTWVSEMDVDSLPSGGFFRRLLEGIGMAPKEEWDDRAQEMGAYPTAIAVRHEGGLHGAAFGLSSVSGAYGQVRPLMVDALHSVGSFQEAEEAVFRDRLSSPLVLMEYEGAVALSMLCHWMGGVYLHTESPTVSMLALSQNEEGGFDLFVRSAPDGALLFASCGVGVEEFTAVALLFSENGCRFAADEAASVHSETLLYDATPVSANYSLAPASFLGNDASDNVADLLRAFLYNPHTVRGYPEAGGQREVFVSTYSTLRVSQDGKVQFEASDLKGGISAFPETSLSEEQKTLYEVDLATEILRQAFESIGGGEFAFTHAAIRENGATLYYEMRINNVPVKREDGLPMASFQFQENALVKATLWLEKATAEEDVSAALPPLQAAAAIQTKEAVGLKLRYAPSEHGLSLTWKAIVPG